MNYLNSPLSFKLRKTLRYVKLYGIVRTLVKVRSQLHMNSGDTFAGERWRNAKAEDSGDVAIVGCGNFAYSTIAYYVAKNTPGKIKLVMDLDKTKALSLAKAYGVAWATVNFEDIINDPEIKIVYIASNHHTHALYAIEAIKAGKHVHIEKPHAVSFEQLEALRMAASEGKESRIFLGFNRPKSKLFKILNEALEIQNGPTMINWFIAGHEIEDDHWYFSQQEGGRVLGNLFHWSDLSLHLVGLKNSFPCWISPARVKDAKSDFSICVSFRDESQAAITFSAKGHAFEGVREYLNVHKGNLLASLRDFGELQLTEISEQRCHKLLRRDHGHMANVTNSYNQGVSSSGKGEDFDYVIASGFFILKIKEALESGEITLCDPFEQA